MKCKFQTMKKTLIINKAHLNLGGIESNIYKLARYALSQNYRVIWLAQKPLIIFHGFQDILDRIEIIYVNKYFNKRSAINKLAFSFDEAITILSFTTFDHDYAIRIKEKHTSHDITPLYILPDTRGAFYYIEEYFSWPLHGYVQRKMAKIMKEWADRGDVRYYTQTQRIACEKKYNFSFTDVKDKVVPPIEGPAGYDITALRERAKRESFNIISVSRFDFPHKQFLLGLVDAYAQLKTKYNQLKLYIIGYGIGESLLLKKIDALPEQTRKDIHLLGAKTLVEIDEIMTPMHLNISVASSVFCGARNCVVSIPARNFCGDVCEVYGYLPESFSKLTSKEPGMPVDFFIEELINMTDEEFSKKCVESYEACSKFKHDPEYVFRQRQNNEIQINKHHIFFDIFNHLKTFSILYRKIIRFAKGLKGKKIA